MNTFIRFFVQSDAGYIVDGPYLTLSDAVLEAAKYDGWGATYQRDECGEMRLYSGRNHLGNNTYYPAEEDAFRVSSDNPDDDEAIAEVAMALHKLGTYHSRYQMGVVIVQYDADGRVATVNGETLVQRNAYADDPAAAIAHDTETFALTRS